MSRRTTQEKLEELPGFILMLALRRYPGPGTGKTGIDGCRAKLWGGSEADIIGQSVVIFGIESTTKPVPPETNRFAVGSKKAIRAIGVRVQGRGTDVSLGPIDIPLDGGKCVIAGKIGLGVIFVPQRLAPLS